MTPLQQKLKDRALEIRRANQNVDLALIETILFQGAELVIEDTTNRIAKHRGGMIEAREKAGRPQ